MIERNGRHEETRTPDLYRVNESITSHFNNLRETDGFLSCCKYVQAELKLCRELCRVHWGPCGLPDILYQLES